MRLLDPEKPKSSKPRSSLKKPVRRRILCGRAQKSGQPCGRPFLAISKNWKALPDLILSEHHINFFFKREAFTCPDSVEPSANPSHRRWLWGHNAIAAHAGDRLSGQADIPAGTTQWRKQRAFRRRRGEQVESTASARLRGPAETIFCPNLDCV